MALLFSAVTLTAGNRQKEFLVSGIPREADDFEGWTAYEDFMGGIDFEQDVAVHAEAPLYGEGETVNASPRRSGVLRNASEGRCGISERPL